jgi:hypothetical protein
MGSEIDFFVTYFRIFLKFYTKFTLYRIIVKTITYWKFLLPNRTIKRGMTVYY